MAKEGGLGSIESFSLDATTNTVMGDAFDFASSARTNRRDASMYGKRRSAVLSSGRKCNFLLPVNRRSSICRIGRKESMRREALLWAFPSEDVYWLDEVGNSNAEEWGGPESLLQAAAVLESYERRRSTVQAEDIPHHHSSTEGAFCEGSRASDGPKSSVCLNLPSLDRPSTAVSFETAGIPRQPLGQVPELQSAEAENVGKRLPPMQHSGFPLPAMSTPSGKGAAAAAAAAAEAKPAEGSASDAVKPSPKAGEKAAKPRKMKNRKPVYWTPEDHQKFVQGLEKFGLQKGLGPGGAELMSVYMGNRTILQIKSHFQKYLSDLAVGRSIY